MMAALISSDKSTGKVHGKKDGLSARACQRQQGQQGPTEAAD
jgi:hypothetical protein